MPRLVVVEGPNRGAVLRLLPAENRLGRDPENECALPDEGVSRVHAVVSLTAGGGYELADRSSKNGTFLNGVRTAEPHVLEPGDEVRVGGTVLVFQGDDDADEGPSPGSPAPTATVALAGREARARRTPRGAGEARGARYLVGESAQVRKVAALVEKLAPLETTVLITGESGTGKELVAEALHRLGPRRAGPFVAVNAAVLEPTLLESELFGHERGAFTGAVARRLGKLELARGGTLFLDELGELKPEAQAKLLRAIERREFERVGGSERLVTDARFVAATNRDLSALAKEGRFREDLLFRLKVVEVALPPLRERPEDLPPLVEHFLAELRPRVGARARRFSPGALAALASYRFPGNVRELRNLVERALIFAEGDQVTEADLPPDVVASTARGGVAPCGREAPEPPAGEVATLEDVEKAHIARALAAAKGNKTRVAALLGIDRATLYAKIKRYNLAP